MVDHLAVPTSHTGNKYICAVIDMYSRFVIAWPTKTLATDSFAREFYENVLMRFGFCSELFSDNSLSFQSTLVSSLCAQFNISQVFSSPYYPQANGAIERTNRTLLQALRLYANKNQQDWDLYLQSVVFSINNAPVYSTGVSPYLLVHGRYARSPMEAMLPDDDTPITVKAHLAKIARVQSQMHKIMTKTMKATRARMKHNFDKSANKIHFEEGDLVYMKIKAFPASKFVHRKLAPRYSGPYLVIKKNSRHAVHLKKLSNGQILDRPQNISRLKHARSRPEALKLPGTTSKQKHDPKVPSGHTVLNRSQGHKYQNDCLLAPKQHSLGTPVYHEVKQIMRATELDGQTLIELLFQDGDVKWVPLLIANDKLKRLVKKKLDTGKLKLSQRIVPRRN
jgi:hypothetical protein